MISANADERLVPALPPPVRFALVFAQLLCLAGVWSLAERLDDRVLVVVTIGIAALLISPASNALLWALGIPFVTRRVELKRYGAFGIWCRVMALVLDAAFLMAVASSDQSNVPWQSWVGHLIVATAVFIFVLSYAFLGVDVKSTNTRAIAFNSVRPKKPPRFAMLRLALILPTMYVAGLALAAFEGLNGKWLHNVGFALIAAPIFMAMILTQDWTPRLWTSVVRQC